MGKLLAAGGAALIALLVLLWYQIHAPAEAATAAAQPKQPTPIERIAAFKPAPTGLAADLQKVGDATQGDKIDPASDDFFYKFYDLQPSMLTRNAAKCYTGGLHRVHRNQKLKLGFYNHIENGVVTVRDVKVLEDTINDPELTNCFIKEVANTKWTEPRLPNWDQPDELVIRPERGMKKFTKENLDYQGDGPDFSAVHPI